MAPGTNPLVHPKYKTRYSVTNCAEYDRAPGNRGGTTLWMLSDNYTYPSCCLIGKRYRGLRSYCDQAWVVTAVGHLLGESEGRSPSFLGSRAKPAPGRLRRSAAVRGKAPGGGCLRGETHRLWKTSGASSFGLSPWQAADLPPTIMSWRTATARHSRTRR